MKYGWIIFFSFIPLLASAQKNSIDSIKVLVSTVQNNDRVDLLNNLAFEYYRNALPETFVNVQTDSARKYATLAYNDALKLQYKKGLGVALQHLGEIARDRSEFALAEKYFLQSLSIFRELGLKDKESWTSLTLGWCWFRLGKYPEAQASFESALPNSIETGDKGREAMLNRLIANTYAERGYNENAFKITLKAIKLSVESKDPRGLTSSPLRMAMIYLEAGEKETALSYYQLAAENTRRTHHIVWYIKMLGRIANVQNKYDSAIYYFRESYRQITRITPDTSIWNKFEAEKGIDVAETYLKMQQPREAIAELEPILLYVQLHNDKNAVMRVWRNLARSYLMINKINIAEGYTKKLVQSAQITGARPYSRDAFELLWQIYDRQHKIDSAYKYNVKFITLKDSLLRDENRRNMALSEMTTHDQQQKNQISLLQKDQQISKEQLTMQQQKLKSETLIRNLFIVGGIVVALITAFIFRYILLRRKNEKQRLEHKLELQQLENENAKIEFQKQSSELEMQALRAQMNPHFIFNCLSSINRFILINQTEEASDYLTKFSRLIRMSLHNSQKSFISLEDELESLRLFLELEQLRFKNSFVYSITFINTIETSSVFLPPMLIQPFVENSIWHGLMHKQGNGELNIALSVDDHHLTCVITDDGVGRNKAAIINARSAQKNKSMGVQITLDRLALLGENEDQETHFQIEDLIDENGKPGGTKVKLKIRYRTLATIFETQT